jgi:spermidine synthase
VTPAPDGPFGAVELLPDADRPGGWLLTVDRIRQSYVDLDDPTYLDFEYMQAMASVLDALPPGRLAVTHVGGGACTFARYVAATRPGSPQIVLEPDTALTALIRARLPLPADARIRIRATGGRDGVAALRDASADVLVLDAYHGGRVPAELTTSEFFAEVARVLRPAGVLLANIADGPPLAYAPRVVATVRAALPEVLVLAEPAVLKGRRFGNLIVAASRVPLPEEAIRRAAASAAFPRSVRARFGVGAAQLSDAASLRSPVPPAETWRGGHWHDD